MDPGPDKMESGPEKSEPGPNKLDPVSEYYVPRWFPTQHFVKWTRVRIKWSRVREIWSLDPEKWSLGTSTEPNGIPELRGW